MAGVGSGNQRERAGRLWVDSRPARSHFPGVVQAIRLFLSGRSLCRYDLYYVLGVMDAWLAWFRPDEGDLIHRLRSCW